MAADNVTPSFFEKALVIYARHFPVRSGKLRVVESLWRLANGSRETFRTSQLTFDGIRIECDLREMLQRQYHYFGTYASESSNVERWRVLASSSCVIVDIGANSGIYSLVAAAAAPHASVHAFEPTPEIAARLRRNRHINGLDNITVHEMALSSADGIATLVRFRGETSDNEGMNFLAGAKVPEGSSTLEVPVRSLDNLFLEYGITQIDLMKLDVQGHEPMVLAGANRLLESGAISMIFIELNWGEADDPGCPASTSIGHLAQAGYLFAELPAAQNWRAAGPWLRAHSDVVARRPSNDSVVPP